MVMPSRPSGHLRMLARMIAQRGAHPTAVILDSHTMQSTPESGGRAGYDGYKRRKGSKIHIAVDTLGHLLALKVTPANEQDREQVADLIQQVQQATRDKVQSAFADQGYTGEAAAAQPAKHAVHLEVVKLQEAKRGFVLLPRRWVVERSFGWAARFPRLLATPNDWRLRYPVFTGWPSLASCSIQSSVKVHDRL